MEDTPAPGRQVQRRGLQEGSSDSGNILHLSAPPRHRAGLLAYRAPRTPGETFRVIREALLREAHLREQSGHPDEWLLEVL